MRRLLLSVPLAFAFAVSAKATVVYDNTSTSLNNDMPLLPAWLDNSEEAGDEIMLGGTDRQATELKVLFFYRGTVPGTFDARIRFRSFDSVNQGPGDVFYDGGLIQALPTVAGLNEYTFTLPGVVVPDHFVWTVQAYNRQGSVGELGIAYYNPPTVGSSDDFFWLKGGPDWTAYSWGGDPYANFGARLTAVPEPCTLIGLGVGLFCLRRRLRRSVV